MKTFVRFFGSITALVTLYACVSKQPQEPPKFDLTSFTTEGKATKTVLTPLGRYDLYDPTQDKYVKDVFDYVYADGQTREAVNFSPEMKPYGEFLDRIIEIQKNDLARAGCVKPALRQCTLDRFKVGDLLSCPELDFGAPTLNLCESKNIERIIAPDERRPLAYDDSPQICEFRHMTALGIGHLNNKNTKHDRFEQFFDFTCSIEADLNTK